MLSSKIWTDEMPTIHRQFGIRINYLNYVRHQCDDLKERVAVVLDRYKDEMTEEQITALEESWNMLRRKHGNTDLRKSDCGKS